MTFTIERIARSAKNYVNSLPKTRQEAITQAFDYSCQVSPFRHPNPTVIKANIRDYGDTEWVKFVLFMP